MSSLGAAKDLRLPGKCLPLLNPSAPCPHSSHLVMGQGVQPLPVILNLGGDVFILQDHPGPTSLSPLCRESRCISERPVGPSCEDPEDPYAGGYRAPSQGCIRGHTGASRCSLRRVQSPSSHPSEL